MSQPTPEMPRGVIDLGKFAAEAPTPTGPPCSKCGLPMPALPPDLAAVAATQSVVLSHDVCPGQVGQAPEGRAFEVRVQIIELVERPATNDFGDPTGPLTVQADELITFRAAGRWADLDTAMRPLALLLGEKWQAAEKQAKLADLDPVTGQPR